ncbi:hypothetical protein KFK09_029335 [Dendrobium nobile]|uniref:RNase H type-1 domain-containing protein n=1 Tax=Dendrobium nobile TaxID=94219 RepID=A0A8T3A0E0_DENNO|nr:hypothetical protein KFK09_029335 [Dendrobium nobile]
MAVRWKVGKGDKINILNVTWMLDRCINRWPTFVDCNFLDGKNVQQLILSNGMWNCELLQRAFHPSLISLITQVAIEYDGEDQMVLMKMCSGKTVSAMVYEQMWINKCNLEDVEYFSWVKKLKMSKNIEVFWWRLGKSAILTNMFLMNHKISDNSLCPRGCQANETYEHIMVQCNYLIEIIMKLQEWGIFIPIFHSLDCCLEELRKMSAQNSGIVQVYCSIVYYSWKNRNDIKHGKSAMPCSIVTANALFYAVSKSGPFLFSWDTNLLRESQKTWYPPPKEWIKVNVDASLTSSNLAGIGGIFRDHKGQFISAFGKNGIHWDIGNLELQAVLTVKEFLKNWMLECKGLIIESDNINIIKFIQNFLKENKENVEKWPHKNLCFLNDFNKVVFLHAYRNCNNVANCCATMALESSFFFDSFSFDCIPSLLLGLIKEECDPFITCT